MLGDELIVKVIAGIVLYNPDINRLTENISAVLPQVNELILIDNGSSNIGRIIDLVKDLTNVSLIKNKTNLGIAKALNQIYEIAKYKKYDWVLSLDQDSVIQKKLIAEYCGFLQDNDSDIAMLTCYIRDRNFEYEDKEVLKSMEVDFCITSGCLTSIKDWEIIGKYDENFFIDRVDTDFCYRLRLYNKRIVKIPYIGLLHEIGNHTRTLVILNRKVTIFNHSPFRVYYIVRNSIYYAFKHRKTVCFFKHYCTAYNRIILSILFEKEKYQKLKKGIKGIIDGHKMILRMMRDGK